MRYWVLRTFFSTTNSGLGLNQRSVAFWQLPHFREEFIRYLNAKKARTLRQLAARPTEEIRGIFKNVSLQLKTNWLELYFQLADEEFSEMMDVFRNLPSLVLDVNVRVEDDSDEEKVTAGSIVTITIGLKRQSCGDIVDAADRDEVIWLRYYEYNRKLYSDHDF